MNFQTTEKMYKFLSFQNHVLWNLCSVHVISLEYTEKLNAVGLDFRYNDIYKLFNENNDGNKVFA